MQTLTGLDTRPTVERVKEGIFSAISFEIEGRRVLDLFAGSGQMGIEALSRGARSCTFVDRNREAVAIVKQNLQTTKLFHNATVVCTDALELLTHQKEPFDLVLLDPPYADGLLLPCLEKLNRCVAVGGAVLCESDSQTDLPERVGSLTLQRTYRYGRVLVRLYRREE